MTEKCYATIIVLIGSTALVFARRYKNRDTQAGYGIAGWTVLLLLLIWR